MEEIKSALYIVPTPVGNLQDASPRVIHILSSVDIVACEDTRHSGQLLKQLGIQAKKIDSYHEHNEKTKSDYLLNEIKSGKSLAIITDAGTPGISDPGYRLISKAADEEIDVVSIPGPTAFVPALVASGLPVHNFLFLGFPPQKKGRKTFMEKMAKSEYTSILYESPYRVLKLCEEIINYCGAERKVCFAREISKVYEEYIRGSAQEVKEKLEKKSKIKGEFVVVIEGFVNK